MTDTADLVATILGDPELSEVLQLVARGHSNEEIAAILSIPGWAPRHRLRRIYGLLGMTSPRGHSTIMARCQIIAWAYQSGAMASGKPVELPAKQPPPPAEEGPFLPAQLAEPILDALLAIYLDKPRGDLRRLADVALRAAGRHPHQTRQARPRP